MDPKRVEEVEGRRWEERMLMRRRRGRGGGRMPSHGGGWDVPPKRKHASPPPPQVRCILLIDWHWNQCAHWTIRLSDTPSVVLILDGGKLRSTDALVD